MIGLVLLAIGGLGGLLLLSTSKTSLRVSGEAGELGKPCCSSCLGGVKCGGSAVDHERPLFSRQLQQGRLYRLRLSVDPRYQTVLRGLLKVKTKDGVQGRSPESLLAEAMRDVALRMGFGPTLLVTHDPTDPGTWHLLTRWSLHSDRAFGLPSVTPISLTPVEEPEAQDERGAEGTGLDRGLTPDEVWAVAHALANDEDTKHLGGFASTMDPDYPVARNLLRLKAMLAALRSCRSPSSREPSDRSKKTAPRDMTPLITMLQKATGPLGPAASRTWERYRNLRLLPKDEKALGVLVASLTKAFLARRTRPLPVPPSPAALQLAYATRRPQLSLVADDGGITKRLTDIARSAKAGTEDAKRAQAKLADANRTLERLQWVGWYRRIARLDHQEQPQDGGGSAPAPGSLTGSLSGWSSQPSQPSRP